jgi:hypothetical protein
MKVKDKRHHAEDPESAEATMLLEELANRAEAYATYRPCRPGCRNTEHYHAKPGAFIEGLPEQLREIIRKLKSD